MSLWQQCVRALEFQLPEEDINTWIRPLQAVEENGELKLFAPNESARDWVHKNCYRRIHDILRELKDDSTRLLLKTDNANGLSEIKNTSVYQRYTEKPRFESFVNPEQTFQTFIEGKSNRFAKAAAQQVAANPGDTSSNPLLIYSGVGLGKTHLVHAIGNEIHRRNLGIRVMYLHSERFVSGMVRALRDGKMDQFTRYYRSLEVLLIDDIQFFADKERSQEEFFHTFNTLFQSNRQIVMTCDRYPNEVQGLQERLRSRFGWGLTQLIEPPDLETRAAILQKKAEADNLKLPDDVAFFIAENIRTNIRALEGALRRVIANARYTGQEITIPFAREALQDLIASHSRALTMEDIQKAVADRYKIKLSEMLSVRRNQSIVRPRQVAMALSKELTNHSLPEIGEAFGGRDHTTVMHACRKVNTLRQSDTQLEQQYTLLIRALNRG